MRAARSRAPWRLSSRSRPIAKVLSRGERPSGFIEQSRRRISKFTIGRLPFPNCGGWRLPLLRQRSVTVRCTWRTSATAGMYLIRNARIRQLTRDHTVIGERVRMGLITPERARNHPERSALNRCLGHELIVSIDLIKMPLSQGDRVIVCSDGLHTVLRDEELEHLTRGSRSGLRLPSADRGGE